MIVFISFAAVTPGNPGKLSSGNEKKKMCGRFRWELKSNQVPNRGVPFLIMGSLKYYCHQGNKRKIHYKYQKTKKVDCPANCVVHHLVYFPDFKVNIMLDRE